MDDDLKKTVRIAALDNARKYNGTPNMGSVIGKLLGDHPDMKSELKTLTADIKAICDDVKSLSVEQQIKELEEIAPELLVEKKIVVEKKLKALPNVRNSSAVQVHTYAAPLLIIFSM